MAAWVELDLRRRTRGLRQVSTARMRAVCFYARPITMMLAVIRDIGLPAIRCMRACNGCSLVYDTPIV
jgi:hypothetical protein